MTRAEFESSLMAPSVSLRTPLGSLWIETGLSRPVSGRGVEIEGSSVGECMWGALVPSPASGLDGRADATPSSTSFLVLLKDLEVLGPAYDAGGVGIEYLRARMIGGGSDDDEDAVAETRTSLLKLAASKGNFGRGIELPIRCDQEQVVVCVFITET